VNKPFGQSDAKLEDYTYRTFAPEDEVLLDARRRTAEAGMPDIQVAALDGLHLEVLARVNGARRAVEIGTLGGYSGVSLLRGMGPGGILHTFELEAKHAEVARETFRRAGFAEQAVIHLGPASEKLKDLDGEAPFDLVFVDADKTGYPGYVEWAAEHLRVGGIVLCDNSFLFGWVHQKPEGPNADAIRAMQKTHEILVRGGRFRSTMLPTGEGLALGVKVR
jgi:caffeoyl-CoA O-methyltransferase